MNKTCKAMALAVWALGVTGSDLLHAAGAEQKSQKPAPYPLAACVVTDEKFGGDMGEPYVFTHQSQEVKLCCKSCLKEFNKDTAKYMKKIAAGTKKQK